jgi:transcriptional regulator with XRE-family HTH domain
MNAEWFAGRLRELREQAGLSRQQLADRAGMQSAAGIRNLEQGIRKPSWETVIALCKALNVKCDAFLQEPAALPPLAPGRPRKAPAAVETAESPAAAPAKRKGQKRGGKSTKQ